MHSVCTLFYNNLSLTFPFFLVANVFLLIKILVKSSNRYREKHKSMRKNGFD